METKISFNAILLTAEADYKKGVPLDESLVYYVESKEKNKLKKIMGEAAPSRGEERRLKRLYDKYKAGATNTKK